MDLNLIIEKMASFLPGRFWKKKGFPLLLKSKYVVMVIKIGESIIKPTKDRQKSIRRLKKSAYIHYLNLVKNTSKIIFMDF